MALYEKVKEELLHKKISAANYDLLISLENKEGDLGFDRFCGLAFQKEYKPSDDKFEQEEPCFCCKCADRITEKDDCLFLHNCDHSIHPSCLE